MIRGHLPTIRWSMSYEKVNENARCCMDVRGVVTRSAGGAIQAAEESAQG
jgi:hypothetical protein